MLTIEKTITSLEVAEQVAKEHKHVMRDIRTIIGHLDAHSLEISPKLDPSISSYFIEDTYTDNNNRQKPMYRLTKKGCELFGTRMTGAKGTQFAAFYVERFNDMETHIKETEQPKVPTTYLEALEALVEKEKEKLALEEANKEQQAQLEISNAKIAEYEPKTDYVDKILQCKGVMCVTQVATDYGMNARQFNALLHELGIQYKVNGQWILYTKHQNKGYIKTKTFEKNGKAYPSTYWTQKGRLFLYEELKHAGYMPCE